MGSCKGLHYNASQKFKCEVLYQDKLVAECFMDKNRLFWASRRGMLELDIILQTFLENTYDELKPAEQALYQGLLGCEDQDLFAWLMGRKEPENKGTATIVTIIRDTQRVFAR